MNMGRPCGKVVPMQEEELERLMNSIFEPFALLIEACFAGDTRKIKYAICRMVEEGYEISDSYFNTIMFGELRDDRPFPPPNRSK